MKKVIVIGSGGAGKSTFSRRLHEATGLPLYHLDKLFWKPNWVETPKSEIRETIRKLLDGDEWILDGNFGSTMEMRMAAADTVVFLDLPRLICLRQVLGRVWKYRNTARPDMGEGCAEKFDLKFLKWIWDYPNQTKPQVTSLLEKYKTDKKIVLLQLRSEIESFFRNLSPDKVKSK